MATLDNFIELSNKLHSITSYEPPNIEVRNYQLADYQYELLRDYIKQFQDELDDNHEIALQLASFGQSIVLNVTHIGYSNPSIIDFYGYYNGNKAHLIQHINQLNFLLLSVPKADPKKPARRIGFDINSSDEN